MIDDRDCMNKSLAQSGCILSMSKSGLRCQETSEIYSTYTYIYNIYIYTQNCRIV